MRTTQKFSASIRFVTWEHINGELIMLAQSIFTAVVQWLHG